MNRIISIRGKMGLLIVALIGVIGVAILQSVSMLISIKDQLAKLDTETSAALSANAVLAISDEEMAVAITKVRLVEDADELVEIRESLSDVLTTTENTLSLLSTERSVARRLISQLELFSTRFDRLFAARRDVLRLEAEIAGLQRRLGELSEKLGGAVAVLTSQLLEASFPFVASGSEEGMGGTVMRIQSLSDAFRVRLVSLTTGPGAPRSDDLQGAVAGLEELIRAVAILGPDAPIDETSAGLAEIFRLIDSDGKLAMSLRALEEIERQFLAALSDVDEARRAADRLTAEAARQAGLTIAERREAVFEREIALRQDQAIAISALVLSILLLVWWVTDRRVVRRIERMTEDMQRVAAGELEKPVKSEGSDEIGQMAEALSIFRLNAIELRRSNEELGNFAYAASHDLRSPLRAIRNLVDWTIEDAGDQLPEETLSNLEMIRSRADRLSRLLTDLLDYARAGSGDMAHEVVHLPGLVRDIADIVDPDRRFDIGFEGDRCITTAKTPLRTIFLNLVSNAIKHHDAQSGTIAITHRIEGGMSVIEVHDDGPGVPDQYREKVFELFQTLKSADTLEGSGMGLAMVRKLVGELGGTIMLRPCETEERGATFIIAIPLLDSVGLEDSTTELGEEVQVA